MQWDRPNRTDNYLMAVAAEIRRGNVKRPKSVKHQHMRLKFSSQAAGESKTGESKTGAGLTREQATAVSQARWLNRMTLPVTRVTGPAEPLQDPVGPEAIVET